MARSRLNSALVAALRDKDLSELAAVMRSDPELFDAQTLGQVADILDGTASTNRSGRKALDHELIARRFWWLHLAEGQSMNAAQKRISTGPWPGELTPSEDTVKNARKSELGALVKRETRLKLDLYEPEELKAYAVELGL